MKNIKPTIIYIFCVFFIETSSIIFSPKIATLINSTAGIVVFVSIGSVVMFYHLFGGNIDYKIVNKSIKRKKSINYNKIKNNQIREISEKLIASYKRFIRTNNTHNKCENAYIWENSGKIDYMNDECEISEIRFQKSFIMNFHTKLRNYTFRNIKFDCDFMNCDFRGARFENCYFKYIDFMNCDLKGVTFDKHCESELVTYGGSTKEEHVEKFEKLKIQENNVVISDNDRSDTVVAVSSNNKHYNKMTRKFIQDSVVALKSIEEYISYINENKDWDTIDYSVNSIIDLLSVVRKNNNKNKIDDTIYDTFDNSAKLFCNKFSKDYSSEVDINEITRKLNNHYKQFKKECVLK